MDDIAFLVECMSQYLVILAARVGRAILSLYVQHSLQDIGPYSLRMIKK